MLVVSLDHRSTAIDIHVDVPAVKFRKLAGDIAPETEDSASIRTRVIRGRERISDG